MSGDLIAIIGGGISGLSTAAEIFERARSLSGPAPNVIILEEKSFPGGKVRSVKVDGYLCESGPNGWLDRGRNTLSLCHRIGLESEIQVSSRAFRKRYLCRKGRLVSVPSGPISFLHSPLLPPLAKIRMIAEPLIPRQRDGRDESLTQFATRRLGREAHEILIDAMQSGIYAGDPNKLSARSCFPRVVGLEKVHGSLTRGMIALMAKGRLSAARSAAGPTGKLITLKGGMQRLTDRLAATLPPKTIRASAPARRILAAEGGGFRVMLRSGEVIAASVLILSCPAYVQAELLQDLDPKLAALVGEIEYAPLAVCCLGFRRDQLDHPLDGFGFLVPRGERSKILGALFSSTIFPVRSPPGRVLIRTMIGGARNRGVVKISERRLIEIVLDELRSLLGIRGSPQMQVAFLHEAAIPQYNVGHDRRLAAIERRASNLGALFIGGNAYRGIGVNDCISEARRLAASALAVDGGLSTGYRGAS